MKEQLSDVTDVYIEGEYFGKFRSITLEQDYESMNRVWGTPRQCIEITDRYGGYTNLTKAIRDGEPIDFEALDGRRVKFTHDKGTVVKSVLRRRKDKTVKPSIPSAWVLACDDLFFDSELVCGFNGCHGWTMYVEGEVPLRTRTVLDMKPGEQATVRYRDVTYKVVRVGDYAVEVDSGFALARPLAEYEIVE